jgi:energy-coupling factor transport system substrate-specific component
MINARALAGWSAACLVVALVATNPVYRALVLAAGLAVVLAGAELAASRRLLLGVGVAAFLATLFSFSFSHLGADVLFRLPDGVPGPGGPFTLEALAFGATAGLTLSAAVLSVAPLGLLLEPHQVVDAFGPSYGFLTGAFSLLVSAVATGGVGPWVPYQMLAAGWVGAAAGLAGLWRAGRAGRAELMALAVVGALMDIQG